MEDNEKAPTIKLRISLRSKPLEGGVVAASPTCSLCARSFFSAKALYGHMRWHGKAPPPPAPPGSPRPTDCVNVPPRPQPPLLRWSSTAKRTTVVPVEIHPEVFDEREDVKGEDAAAVGHPSEESCTDVGVAASSEADPGALEQCGLTREPSEAPPCDCDCCRRWLSRRPCDPAPPAPSFACSPCGKTFASYHALCGHMASHPKQRHDALRLLQENYHCASPAEGISISSEASKIRRGVKKAKSEEHRCNVCGRVFPTGQALGGHKRLHWQGPKTCPTLLLLPPAAATAGEYVLEKGTAATVHDFDLNEVPMVEDGEAARVQELLLLL